jgi:hypothetical protein
VKKKVYNLEFEAWCNEFTVYGYRFYRVDDYGQKVIMLQHRASGIDEFDLVTTTGKHVSTAYVDLPEIEDKAVLEWADNKATALQDIELLLTLFTGRDVFIVDEKFDENDRVVILADSDLFQWGGVLRCSIPYESSEPSLDEMSFNIGFEKSLNETYSIIRTEEWQRKYENGYFLILSKQAFKRQTLESTFLQCWTIWEHLFAILNKQWLSEEEIIRLSSSDKIAYILVQYALKDGISKSDREKIKTLVEIRNKLIHFGRFPKRQSVHDKAQLFIRLTEFIIAKVLKISPSNVFNTIEKFEKFFTETKVTRTKKA